MAEALLTLRDIAVQQGSTITLRIPSLAVYSGEVVAIIGPNGAGKSTLLRVMGLLEKPTRGTVYFQGEEATAATPLSTRRRIASVFQQPLLLRETVYYNASLGLRLRGLARKTIDNQLHPWLERLDIAHLASRQARTLSGGEAQRTSLARALALDPELLLLDEPFSALDAPTRETLLFDLLQILKETDITTAFVTHDLHEARMLGTRVGVLNRGNLLQLGLNREVFTRPWTEEVAEIVGVTNRIQASVESVENDMSTVRLDASVVRVKGVLYRGETVLLCLRPEDISLDRSCPQRNPLEWLNRLRVKIEAISPWMAQYRITMHAGNRTLTALLSKSRCAELCLSAGDVVIASFDPQDVHVIRRHTPVP